jgi:hypothetical protein
MLPLNQGCWVIPTTGMSQLVILVRTFGLNVWFMARLPWYNKGYVPKVGMTLTGWMARCIGLT